MGQKLRKFKEDVIDKLENRPNSNKAASEDGEPAVTAPTTETVAANGTTLESVDVTQVEAKVDHSETGAKQDGGQVIWMMWWIELMYGGNPDYGLG